MTPSSQQGELCGAVELPLNMASKCGRLSSLSVPYSRTATLWVSHPSPSPPQEIHPLFPEASCALKPVAAGGGTWRW